MDVLRFIPDAEHYDVVRVVDRDALDRLSALDGRPVSGSWSPPTVELVHVGERGDFPGLSWSVPVLSARAWQVLQDRLGDDVEPLELRCQDEDLTALNVFLADALDSERSDLVTFPAGGVMKIRRHAFRDEAIIDRLMFKIPESPGEVLVTAPFVELIERAALRGALFLPL